MIHDMKTHLQSSWLGQYSVFMSSPEQIEEFFSVSLYKNRDNIDLCCNN